MRGMRVLACFTVLSISRLAAHRRGPRSAQVNAGDGSPAHASRAQGGSRRGHPQPVKSFRRSNGGFDGESLFAHVRAGHPRAR